MGKIKLDKDQKQLLHALAQDVGVSESDILYFLFEMGMGAVISYRQGKDSEMIKGMQEQMEKDPRTSRLAQRIEAFWLAGQE